MASSTEKNDLWTKIKNAGSAAFRCLIRWRTVERLKLILEVIAIPIAALWVLSLYLEADAPSLNQRTNLTAEITWYDKRPEQCRAELRVAFHNIGKRVQTIGRVNVRAWYIPEPTPLGPNELIRSVDPTTDGAPLILNTESELLKGSYNPDEQITQSFVFDIRRKPHQQVFLSVDLWRAEDVNKPESSMGYATWDWICGDTPYPDTPTAESSKTPTPTPSPTIVVIP